MNTVNITDHTHAATGMNAMPAAPVPYADGPRLLADIGGTNARFALESSPGAIGSIRAYQCANHAGLTEILRQYFADMQVQPAGIRHAAVAIAGNPVNGDEVCMTNLAWTFSIRATCSTFGFDTLLVVNDFTALAKALPSLTASQLEQIGGGQPVPHSVMGLFGPGTGLGVSGLVPCDEGWFALASEGGHISFAPQTEPEDCVLRYARTLWSHVSCERIASGPGIELIHRALAARDGVAISGNLHASEIVQQAHEGNARATQTIDCFCGVLGTFAGDLAITLGAHGGIYVGGGVVQHLGELFSHSSFRQRFEAKGRLSACLATIPTYVITAEYPTFTGAATILAERLATLHHG